MSSNGNGHSSSTASETLEHEAEINRVQIAQTLDELKERMSPGQLIDEFIGLARGTGGGDIVRSLGQHAKNNPVPAALISTGIGMLLFSGSGGGGRSGSPSSSGARSLTDWIGGLGGSASHGPSSYSGEEAAQTSPESGPSISEKASHAMQEIRDHTSSSLSQASSALGHSAEAVKDTLSHSAEAVAERARRVGGNVSDLAQQGEEMFSRLLREQPLILAGVGFALGAVLGAAIPATQAENKLAGETSDQLKQRASNIAHEQMEKVSETASHVVEEVKSAVAANGQGEQPGGGQQEPGPSHGGQSQGGYS